MREVEEAFVEIQSQEEITAADLEEFREALNAIQDPMTAQAIRTWLPHPWDELYEFVEAGGDRRNYWRVSRNRREPQSEAEAERMERFREAAEKARGVKGTVERDGKEIPASAAVVADETGGDLSVRDRVSESGRKALQRLRSLL